MSECVIIGGGGHAKVVLDILLQSDGARPVAVIEADSSRWGAELLGVPIVGGNDNDNDYDDDNDKVQIGRLKARGVTNFVVGIGGTGDNRPRKRLYEMALAAGLAPVSVRHPSVVVSAYATMGEGVQLFPRAVVNAGAVIGVNVIINSGAVVEHDCKVGNHVHIAPGAILCAGVEVGELAHIGAGAVVRQGVRIGAGAVVGAGAAVIRDVPDGAVVAGVPARQLTIKN